MKNDAAPGKCVFCRQDKKPSFTEYYCDCDEVTEKIKKVDVEDDKEDYSPNPYLLPSNYSANLSSGLSVPMRTQVIIDGVQMTHWLECMQCHSPAMYVDHDPLSRPGENICGGNGYFQLTLVPISAQECFVIRASKS